MTFDIQNLIKEDTKQIKDTTNMGRPKKLNKCDQKINVYFTKNEVENLKEVAESKGMTISSYLRYLYLKDIKE